MSDQDGSPTNTVADVAEQLMREFGHVVSLVTVTASVLNARRDVAFLPLHHVPPNLLDRLARARMLDALQLGVGAPHSATPPGS